jgi:hypothetical protein
MCRNTGLERIARNKWIYNINTKPEGAKQLGSPLHRRGHNVLIDHKGIKWKEFAWLELGHSGGHL